MTLHPYLNFDGNCREAFDFYRNVFGGEFDGGIMRFGDVPPMEGQPSIDPAYAERVMHVALPIGPHTMLMGSDWPTHMLGPMQTGNAYSITVSVDSRAEADRIFQGLSQKGKVTMPIGDTFWNAYFGMCTDQFGTQWMVSHDTDPDRIEAARKRATA